MACCVAVSERFVFSTELNSLCIRFKFVVIICGTVNLIDSAMGWWERSY
jgi:hypothetical protein